MEDFMDYGLRGVAAGVLTLLIAGVIVFGLAKTFGNPERRGEKLLFATGAIWTFGIVKFLMDYLFLGADDIAHNAAIYVGALGIGIVWTLVTIVWVVVYGKEK